MASIGKRPQKQPRPGVVASSSNRSSASEKDRSEAFRKMQDEEAERERFEDEFKTKSEQEERVTNEKQAQRERARREAEEAVKARKGKPNPTVFLDVEVRTDSGRIDTSGRLEIELFADVVPKTAENFRCLCTGEKGKGLHFKGSSFHRIIPGFMAQGGDMTNGDGTGGRSIYGPTFDDENFRRLHARGNLLSMANSGPDTNNSQFFILFSQAKHLDRKHVVFGEIIREDGDVIKKMEAHGSESGEVEGQIVVIGCGELSVADEQASRERFRRMRSRTRSASRRRKQRKCYI